jgi:nitroreductase
MSSIKIANTQNEVIDLIRNRWSPRSYSAKDLSLATLETILEAGSWAPSANNSQPWRFIYALRGTPGFEKYYMHDVGMASSFMLLQAMNMDVYGHVMGGFNKQQVAEITGLPANEEPVSMIALGYIDGAEKLDEPYKTRELTPRSRNPLPVIAAHLD